MLIYLKTEVVIFPGFYRLNGIITVTDEERTAEWRNHNTELLLAQCRKWFKITATGVYVEIIDTITREDALKIIKDVTFIDEEGLIGAWK